MRRRAANVLAFLIGVRDWLRACIDAMLLGDPTCENCGELLDQKSYAVSSRPPFRLRTVTDPICLGCGYRNPENDDAYGR